MKGQATSLSGQLLVSKVAEEERDGLLAVDLEPVGADQVLLVEHRVVRAEESKILKLKMERKRKKCENDCNKHGVQGISIRPIPVLVNLLPAVAYLFCLNLSAAFSQSWNGLIEILRMR